MEKQEFGKLTFSEEVLTTLTNDELREVKGGLTTSNFGCTGITCCGAEVVTSCGLSFGCDSCIEIKTK